MADAIDAVELVSTILVDHGPLDEDDIAQHLRALGVADPDAALELGLDELVCPVGQLADDRWVWLPTVLAGRVFTHRLHAHEVAHDILTVSPDLGPITGLCEHAEYQRLADGSPVSVAMVGYDDELLEERGIPEATIEEGGVLVLPPGTLGRLEGAEGDLVGVRLSEQGLVVERVSPTSDARVGARLAATLRSDEPVHVDAAVWTACVEDPAVFTEPVLPLHEIIHDHGLALQGDLLAPAGFDFARWRFELDCTLLAIRHELDPDDALALRTLIEIYDQISLVLIAAAESDDDATGPEITGLAELAAEFGAGLADPLLAELLVEETVGTGRAGAAALGLFAEVMEPKVPRRARVACRWLQAVALERIGDIDAAERALLAAESMDMDWPLPLFDLARFASDRGDVERGLALLRRAGAEPEHPLVLLLEQFRPEVRQDLGRNESCWCGSGRKYKKCHLGREQAALTERATWLYIKATQHALRSGWHDLLLEAELERGRYTDEGYPARDDPLPMDAALFEGGAFADFLQIRGSMLPEDERLLAEQWLAVERSVHEVEQVSPGRGFSLRDVRSGDRHEVRERSASRQLKSGQLICARVVPAGDDMQIFGGLEPVALHERDALIDLLDSEPDAVELVAFLSRRFAPPTMTNTEGDPLAICEATLRVGDVDRLAAALDETYDRVDGEDPPQWFEHVVTHGMERIRATFVLDGNTLCVETNSEQRMDRALAALTGLDPAIEVLDDTRQAVHDARELAKQFPGAAEQTLAPEDPEAAAALEEFIRDYEAKWLDEPIPALDGSTPRQAAEDPTRRGDLLKLLDTFPAGAAARGGMDADRLRAALGLG